MPANNSGFAPRCSTCDKVRQECGCETFRSTVGMHETLCQCNQGRLPCTCKQNVLRDQAPGKLPEGDTTESPKEWQRLDRKSETNGPVQVLIDTIAELREKNARLVESARISQNVTDDLRAKLDKAELGRSVAEFNRDRAIAEREALQQLLNQRDEEVETLRDENAILEQRRFAEQKACQAAERRVEELMETARGLVIQIHSRLGYTEHHPDCLRDLAALNPTTESGE